MFEKPGMPKHIMEGAGGLGRSAQRELPDQSNWTPPRLVKLEPGTSKYERAKAAFDLLKTVKDNPKG